MRKSRVTRLLVGFLVASALVTAGPAASSAVSPKAGARAAGLARLVLPPPSGPDAIGTVALRLVDHSRPDPWVASQPYRELMISVFYPVNDPGAYPVAPQMSPAAAKHFDESLGTPVHQGWGIPAGKVDWGATLTHAHANAPVRSGRHPVVLYSPGLGDPRTLGTTLAEDLASRGYVVVTIDHTYDASEVEFPGGRVEPFKVPVDGDVLSTLKKVVSVRVTDTRFVLDRLSGLPNGLGAALDLGRIGMFGQSAGGFTALQTMYGTDPDERVERSAPRSKPDAERVRSGEGPVNTAPRIAAAADLDGTLGFDQDDGGPGLSPLAEGGLKRPFLLMGSQASDHHTVRSWEALWSNSDGPKLDLHLRGSKHHSYTDMESLVPQLSKVGLPAEAAYEDTGWVDPARAVATQRAYLAAFFDRHLRGRDDGLLGGPSPRYPEVTFVR